MTNTTTPRLPLAEQVKQRIAEFDGIYCDDRANPDKRLIALAVKTELTEVLSMIDQTAEKLKEKENEYEYLYKNEANERLWANYLGRKLAYGHALALLISQKKEEGVVSASGN